MPVTLPKKRENRDKELQKQALREKMKKKVEEEAKKPIEAPKMRPPIYKEMEIKNLEPKISEGEKDALEDRYYSDRMKKNDEESRKARDFMNKEQAAMRESMAKTNAEFAKAMKYKEADDEMRRKGKNAIKSAKAELDKKRKYKF